MKARKFLIWLIVLVVAVGLLLAGHAFFAGSSPPPTTLPNPNGYDDFVKAGRMVCTSPASYRELSEVQLRGFVQSNANAVVLVRLGLTHECRIPPYSQKSLEALVPEIVARKHLAVALAAQGRLAELAGRTNEALQTYLDAVRFGVAASHGGTMIDAMVGTGCEGIGLEALEHLITGLGAGQCRDAGITLEGLDAQAETLQQFLEQEHAFQRRASLFEQLKSFSEAREVEDRFIKDFRKRQQRRRRAILLLAARACTLDHGAAPKTAAELVPGYLKAVPIDPVTGTNMALAQ